MLLVNKCKLILNILKLLVVYFINFHFNNQKLQNEYNIHIDLNIEQRNFGKIRKQLKRCKELYDNCVCIIKVFINMYNVIIIHDKIFVLLTLIF